MKRLTLFLTCGAVLHACTCAGYPTTCETLSTAEVAFVGTVITGTESDSAPKPSSDFGRRMAVMRVETIIRGLPENTQEIRVNPAVGSSCYFALGAGQRWLILGGLVGARKDVVGAGMCGGSRPFSQGNHEMSKVVDSYLSGANLFFGSVRKQVGPDSRWRDDNLVDGVSVALSGKNREWSARTDAAGKFEVRGLPPGEYALQVSKPGYSPEMAPKRLFGDGEAPGKIIIPERGCVEAHVFLWPDTRVSGVVTSGDGNPLEGAKVTALRIEEGNKYHHERSAVTGKKGEYSISRLLPGRYIIGVNVESSDHAELAATYHPASPARVGGTELTLTDGKRLDNIDIRTPLKRRLVTMRVRVLRPDDRPVARAVINLEHEKEGRIERRDRGMMQPLFTDAEGYASIEVYEGTSYTVQAQWQLAEVVREALRANRLAEWFYTNRAPIVGTPDATILLRLNDKPTQ